MEIEFDTPALVVGFSLVIFSLFYWNVSVEGIMVSKYTLGMGFVLMVAQPVITALIGRKE